MNTSLEHKSQAPTQRTAHHENQNAKAYPSRTIVYAKLEMTEPGDHDEQEADAVANTIVSRGKIARKILGGGGSSGIAVSQQMESQLSQLQGGGRQMPEGLRNMMESGFGQDFSQVRLHTDSEAASMSSSIHAKAFTLGNDIYFNRGQFAPETSEGQRLVAHELTHVVQGLSKIGRNSDEDENDKNTLTFDESIPGSSNSRKIIYHFDNFDEDQKLLINRQQALYDDCKNSLQNLLEGRAVLNFYSVSTDSIFHGLWFSVLNSTMRSQPLNQSDPDFNIKAQIKPYAEKVKDIQGSILVFQKSQRYVKEKEPLSGLLKNAPDSTYAHIIFGHGNQDSITYGGKEYSTTGDETHSVEAFANMIIDKYNICAGDYVFLISCYTGGRTEKGFAKDLSMVMDECIIIAPSSRISDELSVDKYDGVINAFYQGNSISLPQKSLADNAKSFVDDVKKWNNNNK